MLLVLALAPQLERLSRWPPLAGALSGVTAAVVGVIASLALWFALHVLFASVTVRSLGPLQLWWPEGLLDVWALAPAGLAGVALWRGRLGMGWLLALGAAAGLVRFAMNGG
jgi:chromate transporter